MEEQHAGSSSVANATTAAPSSSSPGACNGASGDAAGKSPLTCKQCNAYSFFLYFSRLNVGFNEFRNSFGFSCC